MNDRLKKVSDNTFAIVSPLSEKCSQNEGFNYQNEGVSMIKVRLHDSLTTLIYYSNRKDTLGEMKRAIRGALGWSTPVSIFQNFPRTELKDCDNKSLEQLEMFPRAAVHLERLD